MARKINLLVVHCSATSPAQDIGVAEIRKWHVKDRGFADIGYHWVIRRSGEVEAGRDEKTAGAHAVGYNANSLGICLVGGVNASNKADFNYTIAQMHALEQLLLSRVVKYPGAKVLGHCDLPKVKKACPVYDVRAWWYGNSKGVIT